MVLNLGCKSAVVLVSLLWTISLGQFPPAGPQLQNSNVQGTVRIENNDVMSGAKVTFGGENTSKTVYTDERGHYETYLSPGYYTMVVLPSINGFQTYWRPLFHVASSARLTLDASLDLEIPCDRVTAVSHKITNHVTAACGGWVYFAPPSKDGIPYQMLIVYPHRQATDRGNIYSCLSILGQKTQVRVAYDLFTLRADLVSYDEKSRTLEAKGDVARANEEEGEMQTAESMTFRIENGEAIQLP